jgi:hypothetical protein
MKAKNKYYLIAAIVGLLITGSAIYQNCGGTQTRSTDFSISTAQAEQYLADVQCAMSSTTSASTTATTAVTDVSTIINTDQGEFFYTQAPSAMGDVPLVAALDFQSIRTDGGGMPAQVYGFFALGGDGSGSLVIAFSDTVGSSGGTTTSTPAPTSPPASVLAARVARGQSLSFNVAHQLDATTPPASCTSSNPLNLTGAITAYNDGTLGLEPASFDGDIFEMELTLDGSTTWRIRSYDVDDGSLQSTIQLEINEIDPDSGQEVYIGDINLTQPD